MTTILVTSRSFGSGALPLAAQLEEQGTSCCAALPPMTSSLSRRCWRAPRHGSPAPAR